MVFIYKNWISFIRRQRDAIQDTVNFQSQNRQNLIFLLLMLALTFTLQSAKLIEQFIRQQPFTERN
jgi:hypothetical protein